MTFQQKIMEIVYNLYSLIKFYFVLKALNLGIVSYLALYAALWRDEKIHYFIWLAGSALVLGELIFIFEWWTNRKYKNKHAGKV